MNVCENESQTHRLSGKYIIISTRDNNCRKPGKFGTLRLTSKYACIAALTSLSLSESLSLCLSRAFSLPLSPSLSRSLQNVHVVHLFFTRRLSCARSLPLSLSPLLRSLSPALPSTLSPDSISLSLPRSLSLSLRSNFSKQQTANRLDSSPCFEYF